MTKIRSTDSSNMSDARGQGGGERGRGRALFEKGSPERGLPTCTGCHGANAVADKSIPDLRYSTTLASGLKAAATAVTVLGPLTV